MLQRPKLESRVTNPKNRSRLVQGLLLSIIDRKPKVVKIPVTDIGITPLGNLTRVPTTKTTVARNKFTRAVSLDTLSNKPDLIPKNIFLADKDANKVAANIQDLESHIRQVTASIKLKLLPLTYKTYEDALAIYENNQDYYTSLSTSELQACKTDINKLEHWFLLITEPLPNRKIDNFKEAVAARNSREQHKLVHGFSYNCDVRLRKYLLPLPLAIKLKLKNRIQLD